MELLKQILNLVAILVWVPHYYTCCFRECEGPTWGSTHNRRRPRQFQSPRAWPGRTASYPSTCLKFGEGGGSFLFDIFDWSPVEHIFKYNEAVLKNPTFRKRRICPTFCQSLCQCHRTQLWVADVPDVVLQIYIRFFKTSDLSKRLLCLT